MNVGLLYDRCTLKLYEYLYLSFISFTFSFRKAFSASSSHPNLGLQTLLLSFGLLQKNV
jgi:hypothetical protein